MRLLVGDIGGTNARLILYDAPDDYDLLRDAKSLGDHTIVSQNYYKNNDFLSFSEVIWSFISLPTNINLKIHSCCFAVAGPVSDNRINFTNREGWIVDGAAIAQEFNIDRVVLINDFVANGYGLTSLTSQELVTLQEGSHNIQTDRQLPVALVGAGTGLGECYLTPGANDELEAFPTEGGHVEFAPRSNLESDLLRFLQQRLSTDNKLPSDRKDVLPRVSVERLVSGRGLEVIYEFLREEHPDQVNAVLDDDYKESNERGRLIGTEKYNYILFRRALETMFAIYGGEVGNVALKYLPYGGLYIAGGIAMKNIEFIQNQDSDFIRRFGDKGRMSSIMKEFPVHVVMKEELGLRGAHNVAAREGAKLLAASGAMVIRKDDGLSPGQRPNRENGLSFPSAVREAVYDYPLTYAVVTSATSAVTAAAVVGGLFVLKRMEKI